MDQPRIEGILSRYEGSSADLIPVLQDIQDQYNYLPKEELNVVAERLSVPLTQIYSVATFFKMFSLIPKGKHQIKVCLGTTCHLRGGIKIVESLGHRLGVEPGYTTKDMMFTLDTVGCLGSCAQAPVLMIDDKYFGRAGVDKVSKIIKQFK
ncbi:MAG: NADH-quinone oxidoreductase subunit NuoE [Deltaproteobacteria bacterium]|nr:NADH-quinone oxidoreductase subunit NuoE [Deltaproteobacteria bacterium]